jgi:hypothetical protein
MRRRNGVVWCESQEWGGLVTRIDHNVLLWRVGSSFQLEELQQAYVSGLYDGVYLRIQRGARLADLRFAHDLPGLKYLEVMGAVMDDSHSFEVEGLRELVLLTKCRVDVPAAPSVTLESVSTDDRGRLRNLTALPALRRVQVWGFTDLDLTFLSGLTTLSELKVEGKRQEISLQGLETCDSLVELELLELRIESLGPLSRMSKLRRLWLIGDNATTSSTSLDLEDLRGLEQLEELRMTYQGSVVSVEPLIQLPRLRDVRLRGTSVADGNLVPLAALAVRATVFGPDD